MTPEVLKIIKDEVSRVKSDNDLDNIIIRDDVFQTLEKVSIVVYYPLEDKHIDGFHIKRTIKGEEKEFVYINTAHPVEKQIFCAAHELGHIYRIDEVVERSLGDYSFSTEDKESVINRFAAELLIPEEVFKDKFNTRRKEVQRDENIIMLSDLLGIIIDFMNYFFVPYKAVIKRLYEVCGISSKNLKILEELDKEGSTIIKECINAGQYTRLNKPNKIKAIENLKEYLDQAEKKGIISSHKLNAIKADFEIEDVLAPTLNNPIEELFREE